MSERVLWDLVERHLSEAEFQCARVLRAHAASDQTLDTLATGAEQRMFIHIDGLVAGGAPVRTRLLRPLLGDGNAREPRLLAACLALLTQAQREPVITALRSTLPRVRAAAEIALALHGGSETDAWLVATLEAARAPVLVAALLRIAARRGIALPQLEPFLDSATPAVVGAAAQAVLHAPARLHTYRLEVLTRHADASVRAPALLSALVDGSTLARATCSAWAEDTAKPHAQAMLWLALTDGPRALRVLVGHLERATHRAPALLALGYSGQLAAVPHLLHAMASGANVDKRLAGEAFSLLTGLSLRDPSLSFPNPPAAASPAFEADDLDADLVPTPVNGLPLPNAEAVAAWWTQEQARMPKHERVLAGKPWQLDTALEYLQSAPLRWRHAVGVWLALRTRLHVDTRAFTRVQRRQLAACHRA